MSFMLVWHNKWAGLNRYFSRVSKADNHVGMGVDTVMAVLTPQESFRQELLFAEADSGIELFLEGAFAPRASELPVEGLSNLERGCELVLVSFNESPSEFGVHLGDSHGLRVAEWQR